MDPEKILIAVDASENSLRAIKYTGDMLGGGEEFHIELLTIERFPDRDLFESEEAWKTECKKIRQPIWISWPRGGRYFAIKASQKSKSLPAI
ncbi:MAG TPA: universal stress protein [Deltaproteobacteria bacterium]|nr:universal stress protein [Deltaproteobacteria bacterium]